MSVRCEPARPRMRQEKALHKIAMWLLLIITYTTLGPSAAAELGFQLILSLRFYKPPSHTLPSLLYKA